MTHKKPEAMRLLRLALVCSSSCCLAWGQQSIGTVGVQDVTIAGSMEVNNGRAVLVGSTTLTAKDHTAEISLARGGTVLVCATSDVHIAAGQNISQSMPLVLALDRGAVEIKMAGTTSDAVITPDLRFSLRTSGQLDLRLRVTRDGDTCVENHGTKSPVLNVADQFGESTYQLQPGQHVLFEHGSLKEVVDNESSPCGCPPEQAVSIADAALSANPATASSPADPHPFPQAVSQGLAPTPPVPQAQAGAVHTQVATSLSYSAADANKAAATMPPAAQPPPPAKPPSNNVFHKVGHFFKRIFGGG